MNGCCIHLYFAEKVREKLAEGSRAIVSLYTDAYRLGALGADVLDSGRLHAEMNAAQAYDLFNETGEYIYTTSLKSQLSYMLGMVTHYVLDSRLTPYIMYLVEHGVPHYFDDDFTMLDKKDIINGLDYYVARAYMSDKIDDLRNLTVRKLVIDDVADLYQNAIIKVVHHSIDRNKIVSSLQSLDLTEKTPVNMLDLDYMNTRGRNWSTIRNGEWSSDMRIEDFLNNLIPIACRLVEDYTLRARCSVELPHKAFIVSFTGIIDK